MKTQPAVRVSSLKGFRYPCGGYSHVRRRARRYWKRKANQDQRYEFNAIMRRINHDIEEFLDEPFDVSSLDDWDLW